LKYPIRLARVSFVLFLSLQILFVVAITFFPSLIVIF